ncbi:hypothetical protein GCM10020219_102010 [Nonomuraea dietziae]
MVEMTIIRGHGYSRDSLAVLEAIVHTLLASGPRMGIPQVHQVAVPIGGGMTAGRVEDRLGCHGDDTAA